MHKQNFEILEWEGGEYLREFGKVLMLCVCVGSAENQEGMRKERSMKGWCMEV
mgnify:CR=1 FL=1